METPLGAIVRWRSAGGSGEDHLGITRRSLAGSLVNELTISVIKRFINPHNVSLYYSPHYPLKVSQSVVGQ